MYQLAKENAIKELVLQTFQYEKELESIQQIAEISSEVQKF